ncbi:hypothetical protein [Eleftheria terrae]|uniref:hypothetical protein n=1 Tax=Eleftheria terrae TaxID=1597781 RepID=UPI00263B34A3|nr:hypothetical protein [Eleftheria terrae]WKB50553.1 hypothetical protein N7L95_00095 [Eleftheria terrae]
MRNVAQAVIAVAMVLLSGAARAADPAAVTVPPAASKGVRETVATAWPKALKICPGLNKYAGDLTFAGVEDNYSHAPKHAQRIEVKFKISEQPTRLPATFRVAGHTCYFTLAPDGSKLSISKAACAALCLDGTPPAGDLVKPL